MHALLAAGDAHGMTITLGVAIAAGVTLIVIAHRLHISAITLLLLGGVALGPEGLNFVRPESLGEGPLSTIVSLAVAIILFEGGLTLDREGFARAPGVIKRLLTVGVLITWMATASAIYFIFNVLAGKSLSIRFIVLCASLVIVTGPTVIAPLLKRIRVRTNLHNILHWEGVLIDPIGVFIALLCYEYIATGGGADAFQDFGLRVVAGLGIGLASGWLLVRILRSPLVSPETTNSFTLAFAIGVFALSETIASETGLLSVTVAGFMLGLSGLQRLKALREFKAEITELMIGMLFILLASRLKLDSFTSYGWWLPGLVLVVVLLVRPLNVVVSSWGQGLRNREKAFLAWVAPRGIVAASMASLVRLKLEFEFGTDDPTVDGLFLETFTYSVIFSTVLLQAPTAGLVARALGLRRPTPTGWMIVGASTFARRLARFLHNSCRLQVLLVDSNARGVTMARSRGLDAIVADARDVSELETRGELIDVGNVLALTDNEDLNLLLCDRWSEVVGRDRVFRWASRASMDRQSARGAGTVVWPDLPKPSLVSLELERNDARQHILDAPDLDPDSLRTPLLGLLDEAAVPLDRATMGDAAQYGVTFHLRRRRNSYLHKSLLGDLVLRAEGADVTEALERAVDALVERAPQLDRESLLAELAARENVLASVLGKGVAVPHARREGLEQRMTALVQVPEGLDIETPDGLPVRLLCLLISPADDPEGHLAALAELAEIVDADVAREHLLGAPTPEELVIRVRAVMNARQS